MTRPRDPQPDGAGGPEPAPRAATPHPRPGLPPARSVALVAAGGAAGALVRTTQSAAFPPAAGQLPWSTLAENVAGALLLGWLLTLLTERLPGVAWARPLLATGLLGAYTTYATVGLELHLLARDGALATAAVYAAATVLLGLLAGGTGVALGRWRPRRRP